MTENHYQLNAEFGMIIDNVEDLTIIQYLIADTAEAIMKNYGKVVRVSRGWKEIKD